MNRMQKMSWWMVIWIGTASILSAIAITILYFKAGFPRAWAGIGFIGLSGFGGLAPLIFKKDPGPVQFDERDRQINFQSLTEGFKAAYLIFGALCMGIWVYRWHTGQDTISIHILPQLFLAAGLTAFFTQAVIILLMYGKDNKTAEGGAA
ncbi:MAG: hypothetical protein JW795_13120 [Chitinivibrionales bacterium]|nr:hypothetical protein [Chitinivibrionales bacterium]